MISALLPVYRRLRLNPLVLALLPGLSNTIVNLTPWGGPMAWAASALHLASAVFLPMIPVRRVDSRTSATEVRRWAQQ